MSTLTRLFRHTPATRRSYSSFFSSKPGGGRYFNSSKPSKSPVVAAKGKSDPSSSDRTSKDSTTPSSSAPANAASSNSQSSSPTPNTSSESTSPKAIHNATTQPSGNGSASYSKGHSLNPYHNHPSSHLVINPKDFKIHQFFSLHRPLLLLPNPPSIFAPVPLNAPLFHSSLGGTQQSDEAEGALPLPPFADVNLDGTFPSQTSGADGDAEAARQLHHAMTMSKIGAVASWEEALKGLGLDMSKEPGRIGLQEQLDKEWEEVMLDSTKRKRRKKMKKHKLKKLRKATRAQRIRIGR